MKIFDLEPQIFGWADKPNKIFGRREYMETHPKHQQLSSMMVTAKWVLRFPKRGGSRFESPRRPYIS
jgi:hypothetical protein